MPANVTVPAFDEAPTTVVGGTPTSVFAFDFPFWELADILVYVDGVPLDASAYTVEGLFVQNGTAVEGGYGSGTVTLDAAVSDCTVTIDRFVVGARTSQFSRASALPMPSLNADLNKVTARQQDLERRKISAPDDRANKFLAFDADGEPIAADGAADTSPATTLGLAILQSELEVEARTNIGALGEADAALTLSAFGALTAGATALATVEAAVDASLGGQVVVNAEANIGTARADNDGALLVGPKAVYYSPATTGSAGAVGGRRVQNLPGRDPSLLQWGGEYLAQQFLHGLESGLPVKATLAGDSNTEFNVGAALAIHLARTPGVTVTNAGVSGSIISHWTNGTGSFATTDAAKSLASVMAGDPDLVVLGYGGTNEPYFGKTAAEYLSDLDAALAAIRAHANGSVQECSVVVCTASMMNDGGAMSTEGGEKRDELFNARVRAGIMVLADKYQCAFFDKNGRYPDAFVDFAAGDAQNRLLDSARVHTGGALTAMLAWDLYAFIVPEKYRASAMARDTAATAGGGAYPRGLSIVRAVPADGWPMDGFVLTVLPTNAAADFSLQILWPYTGAGGRPALRLGYSDGWQPWMYMGSLARADVTPATGFTLPVSEQMGVYVEGDKLAVADGYLTMTTPALLTAAQALATIPAGYRPAMQAWNVTLDLWDGTDWERICGVLTEAGELTAKEVSTILPQRVYIHDSWRIA